MKGDKILCRYVKTAGAAQKNVFYVVWTTERWSKDQIENTCKQTETCGRDKTNNCITSLGKHTLQIPSTHTQTHTEEIIKVCVPSQTTLQYSLMTFTSLGPDVWTMCTHRTNSWYHLIADKSVSMCVYWPISKKKLRYRNVVAMLWHTVVCHLEDKQEYVKCLAFLKSLK